RGRFPPPPPPPLLEARGSAASSQEGYLAEWRRVIGTFQVNIPVHTKRILLPHEERLLAVLRWIALGIPHDSRWHPVFTRYLDQIGGPGARPRREPPPTPPPPP